MTPEQNQSLEELGWNESLRYNERPEWALKYNMVVRLGIKVTTGHKEELWDHVCETARRIPPDELLELLSSPEKLDALAMTILLTYRR